MYLYFDTQGNLKEQINDEALRKGNSNINKLYVFWEKAVNNTNITALWARFKSNESTYYPSSTTWMTSTTTTTEKIPYDKNRDLKFFNYFTNYKFYVITLPDEVLGVSGSWLGTLQFVETNAITTLGQLAFFVSESNASVEADENINIAQWNALVKELSEMEDTIATLSDYYVTLATDQIITGQKTFKNANGDITLKSNDGYICHIAVNHGLNDKGELIFYVYSPDGVYENQFSLPVDITQNKNLEIATTDEIPTNTSDLTNDSNFQSNTQVENAINSALNDYVTKDTAQTITEIKKFEKKIILQNNNDSDYKMEIYQPSTPDCELQIDVTDGTYVTSYYLTSFDDTQNKQYTIATTDDVQTAIGNAIAGVYQVKGSSSVSSLNTALSSENNKQTWNGYVYNITDSGNLNNYSGTTSVIAGDNVAFIYVDGTNWYWDKFASSVDTSSLMDLSSNQTASGVKTFTNGIKVGATEIKEDSSDRINLYYGNNVKIKIGSTDTLFSNRITPDQSNTYDIGRSGVYWKDLYLIGNLKDETNSVPIADINAGVKYQTTAPTANNTSGILKFVVLSSEPSTYYDGYYYIITGSNS